MTFSDDLQKNTRPVVPATAAHNATAALVEQYAAIVQSYEEKLRIARAVAVERDGERDRLEKKVQSLAKQLQELEEKLARAPAEPEPPF